MSRQHGVHAGRVHREPFRHRRRETPERPEIAFAKEALHLGDDLDDRRVLTRMAVRHREIGFLHQRLFVAEVALQVLLQSDELRLRGVPRLNKGGEPFLQFDMQRIDRRNADRVGPSPFCNVAHGSPPE